jgi:outer membrane receptor protein involved in Fe transport
MTRKAITWLHQWVALLALTLSAHPVAAQADSSAKPTLGPVVVTAERAPSSLQLSTASVSRISGAELALTPHTTIADVLQRIPGFALVNFDGLGFDPQLMTRGFYGGGQAEYVTVLVDGRPVAQLQTGLVPWAALPPAADVEAIEVVRGPASALYGDAAIGGVINVITKRGDGTTGRWNAAGGAFGTWSAGLGGATTVATHDVNGSVGFDQTAGFRAHATRTAARIQGSANLIANDTTRLAITLRSFDQRFDEPGALLASLVAQDRSGSDALFRFDHTDDQSHTLRLDGSHALSGRARLSATVGGKWRNTSAIQTLALAPGFGDTQERAAVNTRASGTVQLDVADSPLPGVDHLTLGAEVARGGLDSKYYAIVSGNRAAHLASSGARGSLQSSGETSRLAGALFEQYTVRIIDPVRLSLGTRIDWLSDGFDAAGTPSTITASHTAFSPKAGLNVRYAQTAHGSGNLYLSASGTFKAPTLDQLFDQRAVPVPFPPYSVMTSNPTLQPQRGGSIEAGVYQSGQFGGSVTASASLSAYQMDMRDELDFDLKALRYVNIGQSRHRGIESGVTIAAPHASAFANYTLQSATAQSGADAGKYLKAIPRHTLNAGVTVMPGAGVETGLSVTNSRGANLDDANTIEMPMWTRADARVAGTRGDITAFVEVRNLLDAKYNTTGFQDPAGTGQAYFYPAAGRVFSLGLRRGW